MKQPLGMVAVLFAAGIGLGEKWPVPWPWLFGVTLVAGAVVLTPWGRRRLVLPGFVVLAGGCCVTFHTAILAPDDLRRIARGVEEVATLTGRIEGVPEERVFQGVGRPFTNWVAVVRCETWRFPDGSERTVSGRVITSTPGSIPSHLLGLGHHEVSGVLRPPAMPLAPGLFDAGEYHRRRGVYFELRVSSLSDWQAVAGPNGRDSSVRPGRGRGSREDFQEWGRSTLVRGLPEEDDEVRLLWAMTLGGRGAMTPEIQEAFMRSGTMHVFAISGLHIGLICFLGVQLLRFIRIPRFLAGLIALPLVWIYTGVTGWQPSAIRATAMSTVVVGGWILDRPPDLLNSLAAAALGILAWDPQQLFQAGFQLSFVVVAGIGMLAAPLEAFLRRRWALDPFLPSELVPRWRKWTREGWWLLAGNLGISVVAWVSSAPLTAWHFHLVSPVSLLANLAVVPLSSLALASNLASLLWAAVFPSVQWPVELFNHSAWLWMHWMLGIGEWAARLPYGSWHVARPSLTSIVAWYAVLAGLGLGGWRHPWIRRLLALAALAGLLVALVENRGRAHSWRLVVLPLAGGHAVWSTGQGQELLVDTGDLSRVEHVTRPFLHAQGVDHLDAFALTHGDLRHVGGALRVDEEFHPQTILVGPVRFRSSAYRAILAGLERPVAGRVKEVADGAVHGDWHVLHPAIGEGFPRADDASLALYRTNAGGGVLLLGDLGPQGQARLVERHPELRAGVVVIGLGERGEVPRQSFLKQVEPQLLIVADAAAPAHARIRAKERQEISRGPWQVLFTSDTGALEIAWEEGRWRTTDARGREILRSSKPSPSREQPSQGATEEW